MQVGELVVASDVSLTISGVVLLDKGIDKGEISQATVELVQVCMLPAESGAVIQVVELDLADGIGSSKNSGESKRSHILNFLRIFINSYNL